MSAKKTVLALLEENRGQYLSGAELAQKLGVSRNAIWKAIEDLRSQGYQIDSVKSRGYCFSTENDLLSEEGIRPLLVPSFNGKLLIFSSLESTNQTAKKMAIAGACHGTVIISDNQTNGRAHNDKGFSSPSGGLYMSVILDPKKLVFSEISLYSPFSAICVCKAIEACLNITPEIRLVTDIFYQGQKISGILNESAFDFETGQLQWVVAGVGFPQKITATRNELAAAIINNFLNSDISKDEILSYYSAHHTEDQ